jgi:hypothetical protein
VDDLYVCGIATESCALKTVVDAFERDITPWWIQEASRATLDRRRMTRDTCLLTIHRQGSDHQRERRTASLLAGTCVSRPVAVLDIDGTVADARHRLSLLAGTLTHADWVRFFEAASSDPRAAVARELAAEHPLVWYTGRPEGGPGAHRELATPSRATTRSTSDAGLG